MREIKSTRVQGADIVMESITFIDPANITAKRFGEADPGVL
jgi:hypothetical protein